MTAITCVHGISLDLDCKMCEKENKQYEKEMNARGLDIPAKIEETVAERKAAIERGLDNLAIVCAAEKATRIAELQ